jgi:hypothetical protein
LRQESLDATGITTSPRKEPGMAKKKSKKKDKKNKKKK